jgi:hypothetical protein
MIGARGHGHAPPQQFALLALREAAHDNVAAVHALTTMRPFRSLTATGAPNPRGRVADRKTDRQEAVAYSSRGPTSSRPHNDRR